MTTHEVRWLDRADGDDFERIQNVKSVVKDDSPLLAFRVKSGRIWRVPPSRVIEVVQLEDESSERDQ